MIKKRMGDIYVVVVSIATRIKSVNYPLFIRETDDYMKHLKSFDYVYGRLEYFPVVNNKGISQ